jgi:hypothetical protein
MVNRVSKNQYKKLKHIKTKRQLHQKTIKQLTGRAKRFYMAIVAKRWIGANEPSLHRRELWWSRDTHPQRD